MAITDLIDKIRRDAEEKAEELRTQARNEEQSILAEAEREMRERRKCFEQELHDTLERNKAKVRATAEQEAKLAVDAKRREMLDATFRDAIAELKALPDPSYASLIEKLLETLPSESTGTLIIPAKRAKVTRRAVKNARIDLPIEESEEISSGFLIRNERYDIDYSLEKLVAAKHDSLETELAKILFR